MSEVYNDILKIGIGRVQASAIADDYFPVIGKTIRIDAKTKWGQTSEWETQDGSGQATTAPGNLALDKDTKQIAIAAEGVLAQRFRAMNTLSSVEVVKVIYAMQAQLLPYFSVHAAETVRVGETGNVLIKAENGYPNSLERRIEARIYRENETVTPVTTLTFPGRPSTEGYNDSFLFNEDAARGIYDVEVDVTDVATGITFSQRHNKLITVMPRLCPKPADTSTGYEVVTTYVSRTSYSEDVDVLFELRLWRDVNNSGLNYAELIMPRGEKDNSRYNAISIADLPAGTTLCLKLDSREPEPYPHRLLITGNKPENQSSDNGTPNFTREHPLTITHDETEIMQWGWRGYGALQVGSNIRNVVIDGYGYNNTGMHIYPFDSSMFVDSCLYINNGASDFELFGLDIDGAGFAGISAKTDPSADRPWYWRESGWEMFLQIHHCTVRNTVGEGVYIGYFDTSEKSAGGETYHAHIVRDLRVYRCDFTQNGYDSVQINNACGVEFCYNVLDGSGYRREPGQGSAFSCTMDGKIYNCTVKNNYNIIGVFGPFLSGLEIFNCILTAARMEAGWSLTAWSNGGATEIKDKFYDIHNNIIKAAKIATLNGDVMFDNYRMDDNIFITEEGDTVPPGYFAGSGNVFIKADLDYENIDSALKVADSANYDYQPAHDSPVVTAGRNGKSPFDMRGYKNWYIGNFHAGPLMGIYRDASVMDSELSLTGIVINEGAQYSYEPEVSVMLTYTGTPTKYRISESADMSGVAWVNVIEDPVKFTLSEGFGSCDLLSF